MVGVLVALSLQFREQLPVLARGDQRFGQVLSDPLVDVRGVVDEPRVGHLPAGSVVASQEVFGIPGNVDLGVAERPRCGWEEVVDGRREVCVVVDPHLAILEPQGPQVEVHLGKGDVKAAGAEEAPPTVEADQVPGADQRRDDPLGLLLDRDRVVLVRDVPSVEVVVTGDQVAVPVVAKQGAVHQHQRLAELLGEEATEVGVQLQVGLLPLLELVLRGTDLALLVQRRATAELTGERSGALRDRQVEAISLAAGLECSAALRHHRQHR
jgi:hypothetical protein